MPIATIQPTGTFNDTSYFNLVDTSYAAALTDGLDTTYAWHEDFKSGRLDSGGTTAVAIGNNNKIRRVMGRGRIERNPVYKPDSAKTVRFGVRYYDKDGSLRTQYTGIQYLTNTTIEEVSLPWFFPDYCIPIERLINGEIRWYAYVYADEARLRIYEAWLDIEYFPEPDITPTAPTGSVGITSPIVDWLYDYVHFPQEKYRVKVFTEAQAIAAGFDPDDTVPVWDSGEVVTEITEQKINTDLPNDNYRAYLKVWADWGYSGCDLDGSWKYTAFTVDATPGPVPTFSDAVIDDSNGYAALSIRQPKGDSPYEAEETRIERFFIDEWVTVDTLNAPVNTDYPTFSRASTAYLDGVEYASGAPRFPNGNSILIEEGTTNLLTANQSSIETDATGWVTGSAGVSLSRITTDAFHGAACLRAVADGSTTSQFGYADYTTSAQGTYIGSAYLKWISGAQPYLLIRIAYTDGTFDQTAHGSSDPVGTDGTWQRVLSAPLTSDSAKTVSFVRLYIGEGTVASAYECLVDAAQLEQKGYATSWQLPGAARAVENLRVPLKFTGDGSIEFDVTLPTTKAGGLYRDDDSVLHAYWQSSGALTTVVGGIIYTIDVSAVPAGGTVRIGIAWTATSRVVYVDGVLLNENGPVDTAAIAASPSILLGSDNFGNVYDKSTWLGARFSSRARTAAELADYTAPLTADEDTTYLLTFDGTVDDGPVLHYTDKEVRPYEVTQYRARSIRYVGTDAVVSQPSNVESDSLELGVWLLDDITGTLGQVQLEVEQDTLEVTQSEDQAVFNPLSSPGRRQSFPVVIKDALRAAKFPVTAGSVGDDNYRALRALRDSQRVLLLRAPVYDGFWYFVFSSDVKYRILNMTKPVYRKVEFDVIEVERP